MIRVTNISILIPALNAIVNLFNEYKNGSNRDLARNGYFQPRLTFYSPPNFSAEEVAITLGAGLVGSPHVDLEAAT